jgi:NitT/TauT family transport system substrate-binding protein
MAPPPRRLLPILIAGVFAAACSGPAQGSGPAQSIDQSGQLETPQITVGVLPIVDVAPVYLAINQGLFADEGLTVTPEVVQGGAAAIPALQGGDLDIAYGAWPSFLVANQQGIELRAVSDGVAATPGFMEFLAKPGTPYEGDPSAMGGATVALNTLANLGELALRDTLADAGLDYAEVTAIEMPFPEMGAALDNGSVDIIWSAEPGVTANKASVGAVTVIDSYVEDMEGFPVAGYFVTREFAEQNPNTVAAFTRALQAAADRLNADSALRIETVGSYTELPADLLADVSFPEYHGRLEPAALERVYAKMLEHGMAAEGLDPGSLVLH